MEKSSDDLAQRLSVAALHQWREGFRGMIAFPAVALSTAATAMFVAWPSIAPSR
jgi:hypothetical protein